MKKIAFGLSLCFIVILRMANAQTSVYEDNTHLLNLGTTELNNPIPSEANRIEIGNGGTASFNTNTHKEVTACSQIHLVPNTHLIAPTTATNQLHLSVVEDKLDIYSYTHSNLSQVHALEKFETGVELPQDIMDRIDAHKLNDQDTTGLNPFLEWELALKVNYTHVATGYTHFNYGFYYEEHSRDTPGYPDYGHPFWGWKMTDSTEEFRVRYAFPELNGLWKVEYELYVEDTLYYSYCPFQVTVTDKIPGDGFVKVADNKRVLERDGELFLPIGHNLTWPDHYIRPNGQRVDCEYDPSGEPCESAAFFNFDTRLSDYANAGMDFFRLILSPGSIDIEFEKMGNYFDRMNYAWEIDNIIEYAESEDMYIDFNMKVHYNLVDGPSYALFAWDGSDYTSLGFDSSYCEQQLCYVEELGMDTPSEFLTNTTAKEYYKQKLRYMYSRWGYSQNIALFELISEINQVGNVIEMTYNFPDSIAPMNAADSAAFNWPMYATTFETYGPYNTLEHRNKVYQWQKEMAEYIKNDLKHQQHLLTCSYAGFPTIVFQDYSNGYGDLTFGIPELDLISYNDYSFGILDFLESFQSRVKACHDFFDKPVLISEMGTNAEWCTNSQKDFTKQLWSNAFMGSCGFMFWAYRTNEYASDWQEMIKLKNWILNDPWKTDLLLGDWVVGHAHGTERGNTGQEYWRKDFNYIADVTADAEAPYRRAFGAMTNLSDNYYTNLTIEDSWCDLPNNDNSWLNDVYTFEENDLNPLPLAERITSKNDLATSNDPIFDPWGYPNNYASELTWYDLSSMNSIPGNWTVVSYPPSIAPLSHPKMYVTEDSVNVYGDRAILPFKGLFIEVVGSGMNPANHPDNSTSQAFAAMENENRLEIIAVNQREEDANSLVEQYNTQTRETEFTVHITNTLGQNIYSGKVDMTAESTILTDGFPTGMLIITLIGNSEKHTIRWLNL